MTKPSTFRHNITFGKRFGVLYCADKGAICVRLIASIDVLTLYSICIELLCNPTLWFFMDHILDTLFLGSIPIHLASAVSGADQRLNMIDDSMIYYNNEHTSDAQYYLQISSLHTLLDCHDAYKDDVDKFSIIQALLIHKPNEIPDDVTTTINKEYKQHLSKSHVIIVGNKLMLYKPVEMSSKYIGLIITPTPLRRPLFSHFYAGPSGGHISTYKISFRLKTCCLWL